MTPEQIDQMPAGPEINALIEAEIFNAIPLTDEEWEICKATYLMCNGPHSTQNIARLIKVPLYEPEYYTKLKFRLQWPGDYSSDVFHSSRKVVDKMREAGWLFELYDASDGFLVVRFIHKESKGKHQGDAIAETEALAICRAALKAKLQEAALNKRGEK